MKMAFAKALPVLVIAGTLAAAGCSTVDRAEFDQLKSEVAALKSETAAARQESARAAQSAQAAAAEAKRAADAATAAAAKMDRMHSSGLRK